jgi:hypothetical protein
VFTRNGRRGRPWPDLLIPQSAGTASRPRFALMAGRNPCHPTHLFRDQHARARRSRSRRAEAAESGPPLSAFIASWQLALEAAAKSPRAVRSYTDSIRSLARFSSTGTCPPTSMAWTRLTSALTCSPRSRARRPHPRPSTSAIRVFLRLARQRGRAREPESDGPRRGTEGHQEGQGVFHRR